MNYISFIIRENIKVKRFLDKKGFSKRAITDILAEGYEIDGMITSKNQDLKIGDNLSITIRDENLDYEPVKGELKIVYEDEHILIVDKDYNLTVNSKGQISLANHLAYYFKENKIKSKIRLVNRLDMNTSGLLMVAKNPYAFAYYQNQIESNNFYKYYLAAVEGDFNIDEKIEAYLSYDEQTKRYDVSKKGEKAITHFKTLSYDKDNDISIILADIKTGKTHQIRSQLSYLNHPIIGDKLYGSKVNIDRFLLHCYKISFKSFLNNELIVLESSLDFNSYFSK